MRTPHKDTNKAKDQYKRFTETPINKLIIVLSIPAIMSMLITNVYNLVDTAFVGMLGTSASGAVGVVFGFMTIIQAMGFMFGQGGGALMSSNLGSQKIDLASATATVSFVASFCSGILISIFGYFNLDRVVVFLGSTPTIAPYAKTYIFYIILAAPFMTASLTLNNLLRFEGKANMGMIGLLIGGVLNMVGDPVFMFHFNMGIAGAGLSTCISQLISFFILLSMFFGETTQSKLSVKYLSYTGQLITGICKTGLPSLLRQALNSLTTVVLNSIAGIYGDAAVAAMSIVSRVCFFMFSVSLGIGQGFQPVSAFNHGAGRDDRVREGYLVMLKLSISVLLIAAAVVSLNAPEIIRIFRDDPEVIRIGQRALVFSSIATSFLGLCMSTEMLYQTTGQSGVASFLAIIRNGMAFIPSLYILHYFRGIAGMQEAQLVANIISATVAFYFARKYLKKKPEPVGGGSGCC